MAHFIDRRLNSKGKSTLNRQRFLKRYKQQIKRAVSDAVGQRSVTDVESVRLLCEWYLRVRKAS